MSDLDVVFEVQFALQRDRDLYEANGATKEAEEQERLLEGLREAVRIVTGARVTGEEIEFASLGVSRLSSPYRLERLLGGTRRQFVAYRVLMRLLHRVGKAVPNSGSPPWPFYRKVFGLF
jgi:hypothetical protein